MRILIVNWRDIQHPWAGGGEVNIHEQAKRWVQWGHSVTMLCGRFPKRTPCEPETEIDGVRIIRRGGRFSVYFRAALYYLRHLRGKHDVVVDVANGIPMLTPLYSGLPKVVIYHHQHLKQWFIEMPWPLAVVGWLMERWIVRLIYAGVRTVAISESTRNDLRRVGIRPDGVSVVHPGLDHSRYRADSLSPDPCRLVYLGRLRHYKRLDTLIHLTRDLSVEFPDIRLDVVGIGEDRPHLEELARTEGVADRVRFHGFVPHDVKVSILQGGSVFVMPSLNEGWGISVLEANACGMPAVAFDVPGLNESIRHGETGLLAESYEDFRSHVRTLLTDSEQRRMLAQQAVRWAARFEWDTTALRMLGVLASVCPEEQVRDLPVTAPH